MVIKITKEIEEVWNSLRHVCGGNMYAAAGILGNLFAESSINPINLQNSFEYKLGMSDNLYTEMTDSGTYKEFATDGAGYGIAQWTFATRKRNMLALAKSYGKSIGDLQFQTYFLCMELFNYSDLLEILRKADNVEEAAEAFLRMYEKPSNITQAKVDKRTEFGQFYFDNLHELPYDNAEIEFTNYKVLKRGSKGSEVKQLQENLMELHYSLPEPGADGIYGRGTQDAVKRFQKKMGLTEDGIAGAFTQNILLNELMKQYDAMKHEKSYKVTISGLSEEEAQALFEAYEGYPVVLEEE